MIPRWFMFAHSVPPRGETKHRPIYAAHLAVEAPGNITPACGRVEAVLVENAPEPVGFILACARCLAQSEVTP